MPHIIQLLHPGQEHTFKRGEKYPFKKWNVGEHKRKFMKHSGQYIENEKLKTGQLLFWGEWESPSKVGKTLINNYSKIPLESINNYSGFPKYRHDSLFFDETSGQNTDPCIFGSHFKYGLCKQSKYNRAKNEHSPTMLTALDKGSIILFGSHKKNTQTNSGLFILDTVFVVADWLEYSTGNDIKESNDPRISPEYHKVFTRFVDYNNVKRRLYFGATYDKQVEGMYSFVPSKVYSETNSDFGFERPNLTNHEKEIISPGLNTNFKQKKVGLGDCQVIWKQIVEQVEAQGLVKAINFDMPKEKP